MEQIKFFEIYLEQEISNLEARRNVLQEIKLLLNSDALKGGKNLLQLTTTNEYAKSISKINNLPATYPAKGKNTQKIRYMLNHFAKPTTFESMKQMIFDIEGQKNNKYIERFDRALRGLTHPVTGEMLYYKYKNSNIRLFICNEWLNDDKSDVKTEYALNPEVVNDIPASEVIPENIIWHKSK